MSQIDMKSRYSLATMHFILRCLKRDTTYDACSFNALCRTRLSMAGHKSMLQDTIKRVLHTCKALSRIIILVMNVEIALAHGITCACRQKIVINKRFSRFTRKLHHHACGSVRIHVGVFAGYIVALGFNYF